MTLVRPDGVLPVESAQQLNVELARLVDAEIGYLVRLEDRPKYFIQAKLETKLWSITRRQGGWWTHHRLHAAGTSEGSERRVRAKVPFWSTYADDHRFSVNQVFDLFGVFFSRASYPWPIEAA